MPSKKKNSAKIGRAKRSGEAARRNRYRSVTQPERKLRHILKSNGRAAAETWAREHQCTAIFNRLVR